MKPTITDLDALEILDSRGNPTLSVTVELSDGATSTATVPSGASTGANEATELRDEEPERFAGKGVLAAVGSVRRQIRDCIVGKEISGLDDVATLDQAMIKLDGSPHLARLGANAVIGVSIALTRAAAHSANLPVWTLVSKHESTRARLPVPHFNVVNGGAHATTDLDFQEFMIAPLAAPTLAEAVRAGVDVYVALRTRLVRNQLPVGLGDEGGFAVPAQTPEEVLTLLTAAIEDAGYQPGPDGVAIALDPAANGFYRDGRYSVAGQDLSSTEMVDWYQELVRDFPIWSIEDGLAEDDRAGWSALTASLGDQIQIVGDDIFVTDPNAIAAAAEESIANAALIKPNQIGTVSQTLQALEVCRRHGYGQMMSHRSGETVDDFIADLAVGAGSGQLKAGAPARGERVAKYNRLLHIEHHSRLPFGLPDREEG